MRPNQAYKEYKVEWMDITPTGGTPVKFYCNGVEFVRIGELTSLREENERLKARIAELEGIVERGTLKFRQKNCEQDIAIEAYGAAISLLLSSRENPIEFSPSELEKIGVRAVVRSIQQRERFVDITASMREVGADILLSRLIELCDGLFATCEDVAAEAYTAMHKISP